MMTENTYNNITNECIVTEHGQFTIERNTFHSGRADILFANTNPGFGSDIGTNQFNGSNTGIRALGASLGQHWIRENQFFTGEFDAFMDGDNNYLIEDNDFNPFQNQLNIEIESGQRLRLEITDLFGQVYASKNISESTIINSDRWGNGVYIVYLYSDDKLIKQEKVALLK